MLMLCYEKKKKKNLSQDLKSLWRSN